jgi:hypothetical protein
MQGDGTKTVFYQVSNIVEMVSPTYSDNIILDTTPPAATITSPSEGEKMQSSSVTVAWSGSDGGSGLEKYEVKLDSENWISKGMSSSHTFTGVTNGSHSVYVKATDNAGNSKESTRSFSVVTSSPSPSPSPTPNPSPSPTPNPSPSPSPNISPSQPPSKPFYTEPFSVISIVAGIVTVALVAIGLKLFFKKRKQ